MTNTQLKDKLTKVYNLAVAESAFKKERKAAERKLHVLCKKYTVRLNDFIFHSVLDIDYSEKKVVVKASSTSKRASRRSLIIKHVQKNIFTTASLAQMLSDKYSYTDVKANKKAVAGTLYDMLKNNKFHKVIRHDNNIIEVIV